MRDLEHVAFRLTAFVREHEVGAVFGQDTGFQIAAHPDTVRAPDVAFGGAERVGEIPRRGYPRLAPDLVVEVHRHDGSLDLLGAADEVIGEDVLPGYRFIVAELLAPGWQASGR